jgi:hypothetical protein
VFNLEGGPCFVGVNEKEELTAFSVYPNPANEIVTISAKQNVTAYTVFDITGKVVATRRNIATPTVRIDVDQMNAGVYLIAVETASGKTTQRLVIE